MPPVISDIVSYFNDQTLTKDMEPFAQKMGHKDFKNALEILLNWLQLQLRLKHLRPHTFRPENRHELNLKQLLTNWKALSDVFEMKDDRLDFRSATPEEVRVSIREFIRDHLKPYLFVSVRS